MALAVALVVADVLIQRFQSVLDVVAPPEQHGDDQQHRDEDPRFGSQSLDQVLGHYTPRQTGDLFAQPLWQLLDPGQIQRAVAGNPEHLLVEDGAQTLAGGLQLFLVELQVDGFVEQGVEVVAQALIEIGAQLEHVFQRRTDFRAALAVATEQLVEVLRGVAQSVAALIELELIQADIGDFIGQVAIGLDGRQRLLLLVEDARQQQAAAQHVDLLFQGLFCLAQAVQLLAGLQVLLGQLVEAFGGAQQVVGELEVLRALLAEQVVAAGLLVFLGQLSHGLFRLCAALIVDQRLQSLIFLLQTADLQGQQITLAGAQVLQQAVALQLLAQQLALRIERGQLGIQLLLGFTLEWRNAVLGVLQLGIDGLGTQLVGADVGLGPLRAGLCVERQAAGFAEVFLPEHQLGGALRLQLLQLRYPQVGIALGDIHRLAGFDSCQLLLRGTDLAWCIGQLALEIGQLVQMAVAVLQQGQGRLQRLADCLLFRFAELAVGQAV